VALTLLILENQEGRMKNISLDLLFVLLLAIVAIWTQFHTSALPMLAALGLVPLFGSVIATPQKKTKRPMHVYAENCTE
jgi:hypothetical protein